MHCLVNKGAKGIALIDEKNTHSGLRYVFDIYGRADWMLSAAWVNERRTSGSGA